MRLHWAKHSMNFNWVSREYSHNLYYFCCCSCCQCHKLYSLAPAAVTKEKNSINFLFLHLINVIGFMQLTQFLITTRLVQYEFEHINICWKLRAIECIPLTNVFTGEKRFGFHFLALQLIGTFHKSIALGNQNKKLDRLFGLWLLSNKNNFDPFYAFLRFLLLINFIASVNILSGFTLQKEIMKNKLFCALLWARVELI